MVIRVPRCTNQFHYLAVYLLALHFFLQVSFSLFFSFGKRRIENFCSVFLEQYLVAYYSSCNLSLSKSFNILCNSKEFVASVSTEKLQWKTIFSNFVLLCCPSNTISWLFTLLEYLKIALHASMVTCALSIMLNGRGSGANFCPQHQVECVRWYPRALQICHIHCILIL